MKNPQYVILDLYETFDLTKFCPNPCKFALELPGGKFWVLAFTLLGPKIAENENFQKCQGSIPDVRNAPQRCQEGLWKLVGTV